MQHLPNAARVAEIRGMWQTAAPEGVTADPTLVTKEGRAFEDFPREVCALGLLSVTAEDITTDVKGLVREGRHLREIPPFLYVKAALQAAKVGSDCATMPFGALEKPVRHPLSGLARAYFLKDWEKVPKG